MKQLLIAILFCPVICLAQPTELKDFLIKVYQQESNIKTENHFQLHFLNDSAPYLSNTGQIKQIMLVRHQKVDIEKKFFYNYKKLEKYKSDYDTNNVYPVTQKFVLNAEGIDTVFTSKLHRAKTTARNLLGNGFVYQANPIFNETKPGTVNIPLLYLPKPIWSGLNRVFWMMGSKPKSTTENRAMAHRRAISAAQFLEKKASENGKVLLVAHGYLNHMLRRQLKKQAWIIIEHTGNENLGGTLLVKVE